ncbi:branched-chain amino acid ABC transporter permease [Knoellia flava TL1]|uniref:Branched-chain amino acid ABC transporter permease n=2 Tax=Knoellia flava TaxID=913969 RepID=A0A8H9KR32_9MICO|nr:branched-chain amino acid ABC transporter permease [Knoellia flava TL1]GGB69896.1 branched-chain amino acid ABC transporter permease [Knoellia flava]
MTSAAPTSHDDGEHPAYAALTAGDRRAVLRQSLSVGIATGAYGISFGALGVASGLTTLQTVALSLLLFSGGSQFALVGILGAGGAGSAAVATSTLLGVRNGLYALQTSRILDLGGLRRLAAAQITIDESTAVAVGQEKRRAGRLGFWVTGVTVFVFWNLMTLAGAVVGNALGDPQRWGLDAAAAAAFTALLWPRLHNRDAAATMALAVAIALLASPVLPVGVPVILTVLAAVVVGLAAHGRHERVDPEVES